MSEHPESSKIATEAEPVRTATKKQGTTLTRAKQVLLASVPFLTSVMGAAIGSVVAFFITINYIERYKAEEALRTFAFTEVYQPLKARLKACQETKARALQNSGTVHFTNEHLAKYLSTAASGEGLEVLQPLVAQLRELVENYSKASIAQSQSYTEIENCEREVELAGHDLATVLGLNDAYQKLILDQAKRRPKLPQLAETENVLSRVFGNPEMATKLTKAFQEAQSGDAVRGMSALNKLRSQLAKSSKTSGALFDYQLALIQHGQTVEKEFSELFLRDFRVRFDRRPGFLTGNRSP